MSSGIFLWSTQFICLSWLTAEGLALHTWQSAVFLKADALSRGKGTPGDGEQGAGPVVLLGSRQEKSEGPCILVILLRLFQAEISVFSWKPTLSPKVQKRTLG